VTDVRADLVSVTIDGIEVHVPKDTLIIRAAEQIGIQVPRFCDHPLLDPLGACRQCIVEIEGQRKPITACTTPVADGLVIRTQLTSQVAAKAQAGTLEFLLLNHPLDCPVCDKGGECPLQNQAMTNGYAESRFRDLKRTYPKPIAISAQVLLDRERCVLCARCTRFQQQVAGDPFIELFERGALEQVAIYEDEPFQSYFSGNTVQICPVGALTGAAYRFRARPFDLVSTPSVCEHCASGCQQRTDWRRGRVLRRLAGEDPAVNAEWNCDKGRWAFRYVTAPDRLTVPLVRDADSYLVESSWTDAVDRAAAGLRAAEGRVGVLVGGRMTAEDAYAYAKFARVVLGTNDVDMRARPHSAEEADFLADRVAATPMRVTYDDLETAPTVVLAGLEPEEESPILFLRLRLAGLRRGVRIFALSPYSTAGLRKTGGRLVRTVPGDEANVLAELADPAAAADEVVRAAAEALRRDGAVLLVGERLAAVPGALTAAAQLADATGARLAWVPRRAGERGAVDVGALPTLLPGGRPVTDAAARDAVATAWQADLPPQPGRDTGQILQAVVDGELDALVIGGVDLRDLPDPKLAEAALAAAQLVVSLELRAGPISDRADVVLPVAPAVEKVGTFVDWEGRPRPFDATLEHTGALPDLRVLHLLAAALDTDLGLPDAHAARAELGRLGAHAADRPAMPPRAAGRRPDPQVGEAVLATWHLLLDDGRLQEEEPHLAGTRRPAIALLAETTAKEIGARAGQLLTVSTDRGAITLPLELADLPDRVVWLPTCSPGSHVRETLGADYGSLVRIAAGGATG
jgi:NADH-quinone oxidoreductase subunit G